MEPAAKRGSNARPSTSPASSNTLSSMPAWLMDSDAKASPRRSSGLSRQDHAPPSSARSRRAQGTVSSQDAASTYHKLSLELIRSMSGGQWLHVAGPYGSLTAQGQWAGRPACVLPCACILELAPCSVTLQLLTQTTVSHCDASGGYVASSSPSHTATQLPSFIFLCLTCLAVSSWTVSVTKGRATEGNAGCSKHYRAEGTGVGLDSCPAAFA